MERQKFDNIHIMQLKNMTCKHPTKKCTTVTVLFAIAQTAQSGLSQVNQLNSYKVYNI